MTNALQRKDDAPAEMVRTAQLRFWSRVNKCGPIPEHRPDLGPCWIYLGAKVAGYGWVYLGGCRKGKVSTYAHRLALYLKTGVWGDVAMHACDNRACCNFDHLSWSTKAGNSQDALTKRRAYVGEANSNAKLSDDIVRRARAMRERGSSLRAIAAATGFSVSLLSKVCRGEVWSHV